VRGNSYSDQLCYFVCSVICITIFSELFLEYVVFTNLTLTQAIYCVNNHHTVIAVLEVSLKTVTEHVCKTVYYISVHTIEECKWGKGGQVYDNINIIEEEETTEFISGREKC